MTTSTASTNHAESSSRRRVALQKQRQQLSRQVADCGKSIESRSTSCSPPRSLDAEHFLRCRPVPRILVVASPDSPPARRHAAHISLSLPPPPPAAAGAAPLYTPSHWVQLVWVNAPLVLRLNGPPLPARGRRHPGPPARARCRRHVPGVPPRIPAGRRSAQSELLCQSGALESLLLYTAVAAAAAVMVARRRGSGRAEWRVAL